MNLTIFPKILQFYSYEEVLNLQKDEFQLQKGVFGVQNLYQDMTYLITMQIRFYNWSQKL